MWKRREIAPKEQFLLFSTLFYIYISNFRSQITYSFVKCGCSIYCFPHSLNPLCRSTDISKCFSESLGIRDNESRLIIFWLFILLSRKYCFVLLLYVISQKKDNKKTLLLLVFQCLGRAGLCDCNGKLALNLLNDLNQWAQLFKANDVVS